MILINEKLQVIYSFDSKYITVYMGHRTKCI